VVPLETLQRLLQIPKPQLQRYSMVTQIESRLLQKNSRPVWMTVVPDIRERHTLMHLPKRARIFTTSRSIVLWGKREKSGWFLRRVDLGCLYDAAPSPQMSVSNQSRI
jgi:hypothetical protein